MVYVSHYVDIILYLSLSPDDFSIDLAQNDAYGVNTETQRNREASSVVMSENDAYGAAPLNGQQQSPYEVEPPYHIK